MNSKNRSPTVSVANRFSKNEEMTMMVIDHFVNICKWCGRWLAILLLSLLITLPLIGLSIELTGAWIEIYFGLDNSSFEGNWALGAAVFGYLIIAAAGSCVIIWPLALWVSRKLANRLLLKYFLKS